MIIVLDGLDKNGFKEEGSIENIGKKKDGSLEG